MFSDPDFHLQYVCMYDGNISIYLLERKLCILSKCITSFPASHNSSLYLSRLDVSRPSLSISMQLEISSLFLCGSHIPTYILHRYININYWGLVYLKNMCCIKHTVVKYFSVPKFSPKRKLSDDKWWQSYAEFHNKCSPVTISNLTKNMSAWGTLILGKV